MSGTMHGILVSREVCTEAESRFAEFTAIAKIVLAVLMVSGVSSY
jgi:hypothetical protein